MKKSIYSLLMAMICLLLVAHNSPAQGPDGFHCPGQPFGNFVSDGSDFFGSGSGLISPGGPKPSVVYRYRVNVSHPMPYVETVLVSDSLEVTVQQTTYDTVDGYSIPMIYGTAIRYAGTAQVESSIFKAPAFNYPGFEVIKKISIGGSGQYSIQAIHGNKIYGLRSGGGTYGFGVLFRINKDGTDYIELYHFHGAYEKPDRLITRYYPNDFDGRPDFTRPEEFWGISFAGGTHAKGAVLDIALDGSQISTIVDFTGQGGPKNEWDDTDGEGPVAIVPEVEDGDVQVFTQSGGIYNYGAIFRIGQDGVTNMFSFTPEYGNPSNVAVLDPSTGKIYGIGGNVGDNSGFIYAMNGSYETWNDHLVDFANSTEMKTPLALALGSDGRIYGRALKRDTEDVVNTLFYVNRDGTELTKLDEEFGDCFVNVIDPPDNATNVSLIPLIKATPYGGATRFNFILSETSNFSSGNIFLNTEYADSVQITAPLKHSTTYYVRVGTDVGFPGPTTKFTTAIPATGNQPVGNLVVSADGIIYGSFAKKNSTGPMSSTIYKYNPADSTLDPVYRSDKYEFSVQLTDSAGFIYGVGIEYAGTTQKYFHMFRVKSDGTGFKILRSGSVSSLGIPSLQEILETQIYGLRNGGGTYGKGVYFRMNKDGSNYTVLRNFKNSKERPTQIVSMTHGNGIPSHFLGISLNGGDKGKGALLAMTFDGSELGVTTEFTGFGGDDDQNQHSNGEGPIAITNNNGSSDLTVLTRSGGVYNRGLIFTAGLDGNWRRHDFTEQFGTPFGNTVPYGPGGDFDNNTGFIYSLYTTSSNYPIVATFTESSPVNKVTAVERANGALYGIARTSNIDPRHGALFAINEDGSDLRIIFPFIDGYSQVREPSDNLTEVTLTPVIKMVSIPGATSYTLQVSKTADFSSNVQSFNTTSPQLTLPRLKYATTYYTRVKTNLIDDYGNITKFTTYPPEKYSVVTNPVDHATNVAINNLKVTANVVFDATMYTIELNTSPDFTGTSVVKVSPFAGQRTITFNNLQPGTTYYSRTKTNLPSGWGPRRSFTTGGSPFLLSAEEVSEVKIYPNPFDNNFKVEVQRDDDEPITISLLDITGRELSRVNLSNKNSVQLGDQLGSGVYLVKVTKKNKTSVFRATKK